MRSYFSDTFLKFFVYLTMAALSVMTMSCEDEGPTMPDMPSSTGNMMSYDLMSVSDPSISGTATLTELDDGSTQLNIDLSGTSSGNMHPSHIHFNTAAEGGDIAVSLTPVDGSTGMSETIIETLDDGTAISYEQLLAFDGYINVHFSSSDLATLVAQGDIGENALTGDNKTYTLMEKDVDGIMGTVTFAQRVSGNTLATIMLEGTPDGGMHPAHIHMNSAAEGGGIAVSFTPVNGTTGMSMTHIEMTDDGEAISYEEILMYDGYVNVHLSAEELSTIVAQGDIGINELTGESYTYDLGEKDVAGIMGTVTFAQRVSGNTLATIMLEGTPDGGMHPAHIHMNSAAEGGGIAVSFTPVNGTTGMSVTHIEMTDDDMALSYEEILEYDGYVNVHLSAEELSTIVAQGDIGANELTGNATTYSLMEKDVTGAMGTVTFAERKSGFTLATIMLSGTPMDGMHPTHIHDNTAEEGGPIAVTFNPVDGNTGMSMTTIREKDGDDAEAITYEDIIAYNGYVNVHLSMDDLATLVAQGNIGANAEPVE